MVRLFLPWRDAEMKLDVFALRRGEMMWLWPEYPRVKGALVLAVMARTVEPPPGPRAEIHAAAIVAARKDADGRWVWVHLSPMTKEDIGAYIFDECEIDFDRWYYLEVV